MGNNHYVMDRVREGDRDRLRAYVAWLLDATRGFGVKVVNPGGIERWKEGRGNVSSLDEVIEGFGVTPRQILTSLAETVDDLKIPHPVHVHGLNLGLPGNFATTLDTMKALDGRRAHLAHIQFHSYGGTPDRPGRIDSQVPILADFLNSHEGMTVDVGQVVFGETTSMTADGAVGQFLHSVTGRKWFSQDIEHETGCGVVPIEYDDKNLVHALQWSIGLEWFLLVDDPWKVALSTDHPNGGSFLAYPQIMALLMDRNRRDEALKALPEKVRAQWARGNLARIQPFRDRHHHEGRAGEDARPGEQGAPRAGRRRRRDDLFARPGHRADVLDAPIRPEIRDGRDRRRLPSLRARGQPAPLVSRV